MPWKFQHEAGALRQDANAAYSSSDEEPPEEPTLTDLPPDCTVPDTQQTPFWHDNLDLSYSSHLFMGSPTYKLQTGFISMLYQADLGSPLGIFPPKPYLSLIPAVIGHSQALDLAVASLCAFITNKQSAQGQPNTAEARALYVKALRSLQHALNDDAASKDTEVLAAVMLLQIYEQSADSPAASAGIQHARGAARLIEHRGPAQFASAIDHALLEAEMCDIMMECVRSKRGCFLSDDAWAGVLRDFERGTYAPRNRMDAPIRRAVLMGLHFPAILAAYLQWRGRESRCGDGLQASGGSGTDLPDASLGDLYFRILKLREYVVGWMTDQKQSRTEELVRGQHATKDARQDIHAKAFQCAACVLLILSNHMMVQLQRRVSIAPSLLLDDRLSDMTSRGLVSEETMAQECIYCAAAFQQTFASLQQDFPEDAVGIKRVLQTIWNDTFSFKNANDQFCNDDPTLMAVGDLLEG